MSEETDCSKTSIVNAVDTGAANGQTMLEELQTMLDRMNSQSN